MYWVLAETTGYILDFNLYCGKKGTSAVSGNGLYYNVAMELLASYQNQAYELFIDNVYTSPKVLEDLEASRHRGHRYTQD